MGTRPEAPTRGRRAVLPGLVGSVLLSLLLLSAVHAVAQAPGRSSLVGCVFDVMGYPMPGATIYARGGRVERTTTTDAGGCYMLPQLPAASYRVTARMRGFDSATYDQVVGHADFILRVSRMCECVHAEPPQTLGEAWERAGSVLYVRLADADPTVPAQPRYYRHSGRVLEALKSDPAAGMATGTVAILEHQENNAPPPLATGEEAVIFAAWLGDANAFLGFGDDCCENPETVFQVADGRIRQAPAPLSGYVGMEIERFLQELRSLAASRAHPSTRLVPNGR